jgi:hypothetical protein
MASFSQGYAPQVQRRSGLEFSDVEDIVDDVYAPEAALLRDPQHLGSACWKYDYGGGLKQPYRTADGSQRPPQLLRDHRDKVGSPVIHRSAAQRQLHLPRSLFQIVAQ